MAEYLTTQSFDPDQEEENNLDVDERNSLLCNACTIPIFSTPFISQTSIDGAKVILHDQCINLPNQLNDHPLHPRQPLIVQDRESSSTVKCSHCEAECGSMFYRCRDSKCCSGTLDLVCALSVSVLHRSHTHRLMAIRGRSASTKCYTCRTKHQGHSAFFYFCNFCSFWIHHDCATLPNTIIHVKGSHHMHLSYAGSKGPKPEPGEWYLCSICGRSIDIRWGVYFCLKCRYCAHIKCVAPDLHHNFKPVSVRDAEVEDLFHFPMADTSESMVAYVRAIHGRTLTDFFEGIHEHPLIFTDRDRQTSNDPDEHNDDDDDDDDYPHRLCNACIQPISPPFYSCSKCKDFLLHSCCTNLPILTNTEWLYQKYNAIVFILEEDHPDSLPSRELVESYRWSYRTNRSYGIFSDLKLYPRAKSLLSNVSWFPIAGEFSFSLFRCDVCHKKCSGFAYGCKYNGFTMDIVCASMPRSITFAPHGKSHILFLSIYNTDQFTSQNRSLGSQKPCICCNSPLGYLFYKCSSCHNFKLHARCALLPSTINHRFDKHPLKLTMIYCQDPRQFCEMCEESIGDRCWYYSCQECEQSFHTACFTSLGDLSMIRLGAVVRVKCHDCPVKLVRAFTVDGSDCGYCHDTISDGPDSRLAFKCSKCFFRIHEKCGEECMLINEDVESSKVTVETS